MARLPREQAVLIVCKALNPFVTFDLLVSTPDGVQPIPGAEDIGIKDLLSTLDMQDKKFGLHVIDSILNSIFDQCKQVGFAVGVGKGDLVSGDFATIGDLATRLCTTSVPV